ncbi:MAG: hypothetical protein LBC53_05010, partial [Spirochaetaceae bacterium]|nr:hypothetical protein [Spirochaetaceae bacterium]
TLKPADGNDVKLTASFTLAGNGNLILSGGANGETLTLTPLKVKLEAVTVNSGAILTLKNGAVISGETNVEEKRSASLVKIKSGGEFVMTGGELSGNKISTPGGAAVLYDNPGGAVYIDGGNFTMTGGRIHDNVGKDGGGVYLKNGTFTMKGGFIEYNTGTVNGGGVNIGSGNGSGDFYFSGGDIRSNTVTGSYGGGGVTVAYGGVFYMSGTAKIYGNCSNGNGGGVSVQDGAKFSMTSGVISGNTANKEGGGVYMNSGTFNKTGGMVYGDDDVDDGLKNKADQGGSSFFNKNNNGSATNNGGALSTTNSTF